MKKPILVLFLTLIFSNLLAQNSEAKKVKYANTEIEVPAAYRAKNEYSIENDVFSAQWLYLTKEMVAQGFEKQIISQFEKQLKYSNAIAVDFISSGGQFAGKKYKLRGNGSLKVRILAFGAVDGQPLVLNLGFKEDLDSNSKLDDLMKRFIQFKE